MLGDASLISHMTCEGFELETPYDATAIDKTEFLFAGMFALAFLGILLADRLRRGRESAIVE